MDVKDCIVTHREEFRNQLLSEAKNVASNIQEILTKGNIDLLKNAEKIAICVVTDSKEELSEFAKQEGIAWASNKLTLSFKLDWVHAIRRTLWHFIRLFNEKNITVIDFYEMEKKINDGLDEFTNAFFLAYSNYKDDLILSQRKLVEHLSVPIIPLSPQIAVLPLIGNFDLHRMKIVLEKSLQEIARLSIQTMILDLSGVSDMDETVLACFEKLLIGVGIMGSKTILTGIRPELVRKIVLSGIHFDKQNFTKGTLQQALNEILIKK